MLKKIQIKGGIKFRACEACYSTVPHTHTHIYTYTYTEANTQKLYLQQHQLFAATYDNRTCGTYRTNCLLLLVTKELVEVPEGTHSSKLDTFRC